MCVAVGEDNLPRNLSLERDVNTFEWRLTLVAIFLARRVGPWQEFLTGAANLTVEPHSRRRSSFAAHRRIIGEKDVDARRKTPSSEFCTGHPRQTHKPKSETIIQNDADLIPSYHG